MHFQQSEATAARRWILFQCVDDDSADGYAPKTGLTFSSGELKVAKTGAAAANAANFATVVEAGNGFYWYQFSAAELDTLGSVALIVNKDDVYAEAAIGVVVAYDPYSASDLGLTNIDAAISSRLASGSYQDLDDLLDASNSIETGLTLRGALRLMVAALAGKISGGGTTTITVRNAVADSKPRITATIDSSGNRTAVTTDLT